MDQLKLIKEIVQGVSIIALIIWNIYSGETGASMNAASWKWIAALNKAEHPDRPALMFTPGQARPSNVVPGTINLNGTAPK